MVRFYSSVVLSLLFLTGCVDESRDVVSGEITENSGGVDDGDSSAATFDRQALMTNLVDNIFIPNYEVAATQATAFATESGSLSTYCDDIGTDNEAISMIAAQTDWLGLMESVQKTEMHVIGPALRNEDALHNRMHSYSTSPLATCALDQAIIAAADDSFQITSRAYSQRGMGAIEYLLFNENLNHSCSSQISVTANWNDQPESQRKQQRCALAEYIAEDVATASNQIHSEWTEGDVPFRTDFLNPESLGDNFQLITDGLFYLETFTKSQKLAIPLGLDAKCSSLTCVGLVESPYSESSLRNVRTNAAEFLRIFNGGTGPGFDDLIDREDFGYITQRFQTQLGAIDSKLALMTVSLFDQIALVEADADDPTCINAFLNPDDESLIEACSLTGLLKRVTDDLKIEFVTIVGVAIPGRVQSDND